MMKPILLILQVLVIHFLKNKKLMFDHQLVYHLIFLIKIQLHISKEVHSNNNQIQINYLIVVMDNNNLYLVQMFKYKIFYQKLFKINNLFLIKKIFQQFRMDIETFSSKYIRVFIYLNDHSSIFFSLEINNHGNTNKTQLVLVHPMVIKVKMINNR